MSPLAPTPSNPRPPQLSQCSLPGLSLLLLLTLRAQVTCLPFLEAFTEPKLCPCFRWASHASLGAPEGWPGSNRLHVPESPTGRVVYVVLTGLASGSQSAGPGSNGRPSRLPLGNSVQNLATSVTWRCCFINMPIWHLPCTFHPQLSKCISHLN